MQRFPHPELTAIVAGFAIDAPIGPIEPLGQGLINLSYRVRAGDRDWVLQRINGEVFPHPERIMANLQLLAERRAQASRLGLKLPGLVPGRDGAPFDAGRRRGPLAPDGADPRRGHPDPARNGRSGPRGGNRARALPPSRRRAAHRSAPDVPARLSPHPRLPRPIPGGAGIGRPRRATARAPPSATASHGSTSAAGSPGCWRTPVPRG